ncbi:hypothetical protein TWF594_000853 [Orbilia oligospora]|nr:hypothetical protein TWF594_000853 [Orbilia oligospora]
MSHLFTGAFAINAIVFLVQMQNYQPSDEPLLEVYNELCPRKDTCRRHPNPVPSNFPILDLLVVHYLTKSAPTPQAPSPSMIDWISLGWFLQGIDTHRFKDSSLIGSIPVGLYKGHRRCPTNLEAKNAGLRTDLLKYQMHSKNKLD